jgi:hypothetical protein
MAAKKKTDEDKAIAFVEKLEAEAGVTRYAATGAKFGGPVTDALVDRILAIGGSAIKALLKLKFPDLP